MVNYSFDNIPKKYESTFIRIVRASFGYGMYKTLHKPLDYWCDEFKIDRSTFKRHIKWLSDNGHIEIITHKGFVDGGGSKPNAYAPRFPTGYGNVYIKKAEKATKEKPIEKKKESTYDKDKKW